MKIAILCHMHHPIAEPFQGGTEAHTAMMADELVARGHDVTLFAKAGSRTKAGLYPLVPAEFEFIRTASSLVREQQRGFLAESVHHSIEVIENDDYDVVINNSLSSLPFRYLKQQAMLTILHTPATLADVTAVVREPGWTPGDQHSFVTVSESNALAWRELLPEVGVVRNGVDLDRWRPAGSSRRVKAVWAARITPEKGLHLAIDAARLARMPLDISGPISHAAYFESEIRPRLGRGVRYVGHLSHARLPRFLSSGTVFVASPLWPEPFGLSVVEAMACGTPVAAFANGAMREIVTPDSGALAADAEAAPLATAMLIAAGRDRRLVRAHAESFSLDAMVSDYEEILERLVLPDPISAP